MKFDRRLVAYLVVGALLRLGLHLSNIPKWLHESFEATTPQNSWKNFLEARFQIEMGVSPFEISQSSYHETPIAFMFWRALSAVCDVKLLFVLLDMVVCLLLYYIGNEAGRFLLLRQREAVLRKRISPQVLDTQPELLLRADTLKNLPHWLVLAYSANPYAIMACVAYNTNVLNTIVLLSSLLAALRNKSTTSAVFAGLGAYLTVYPLALLVPILLCESTNSNSKQSPNQQQNQSEKQEAEKRKKTEEAIDELLFGRSSRFRVAFVFFAVLSLLVALSSVVQSYVRTPIARSAAISSQDASPFNALKHVYTFIFTVPDLRPNIGLFWYFFTEVFEHFLSFFLAVFQVQIFVYAFPLAYKFRDDVLLVFYTLIGLICIFRSYPSYSDVALLLSLTPIWAHLRSQMRSVFIIVCIYLACTVLFPILAYLWIYQGSANSNFYYGVSLAFNVAQIFLVTDVLYAHSFRLFVLRSNYKQQKASAANEEGKNAASRPVPTLLQLDDCNSNSRTAA